MLLYIESFDLDKFYDCYILCKSNSLHYKMRFLQLLFIINLHVFVCYKCHNVYIKNAIKMEHIEGYGSVLLIKRGADLIIEYIQNVTRQYGVMIVIHFIY